MKQKKYKNMNDMMMEFSQSQVSSPDVGIKMNEAFQRKISAISGINPSDDLYSCDVRTLTQRSQIS